MSIDNVSIGLRIRNLRLQEKMSQEELAEKAQVSRVFISYLETGTKAGSLESIVMIANALKVSVDDILTDSLHATGPKADKGINDLLLDCTPEEIIILSRALASLRKILKDYTIK